MQNIDEFVPIKFPIKEFKLDKIINNANILIIGKRASGKSWLSRDIIHHYRNIPGGIVVSPTEQLNPFYINFFPDLYIHHNLDNNILQKIIARQAILSKNKNLDSSSMLVMDDCLHYDEKLINDPNLVEILYNGRHYKLTQLVLVPYPLGFRPEIRANFDYVFLFGDDLCSNQKRIYDHYAGMFPSFNVFREVFNEYTKDYGAIVIDNKCKSDILTDKVYWFKAQEIKDFVFGSNEFNDIHKNNYNADHKHTYTYTFKDVNASVNKITYLPDDEYLFNYFINEDKLKCEREIDADTDSDLSHKIIQDDKITDNALDQYSNDTDKIIHLPDDDYLLKYFANHDKLKYKQMTDTDISSVADNKYKDKSIDTLDLSYSDDKYRITTHITNFSNLELIKILCNHIENMHSVKQLETRT